MSSTFSFVTIVCHTSSRHYFPRFSSTVVIRFTRHKAHFRLPHTRTRIIRHSLSLLLILPRLSSATDTPDIIMLLMSWWPLNSRRIVCWRRLMLIRLLSIALLARSLIRASETPAMSIATLMPPFFAHHAECRRRLRDARQRINQDGSASNQRSQNALRWRMKTIRPVQPAIFIPPTYVCQYERPPDGDRIYHAID